MSVTIDDVHPVKCTCDSCCLAHELGKSPYHDALMNALYENDSLRRRLLGAQKRIDMLREAVRMGTRLIGALPNEHLLPATKAWMLQALDRTNGWV
jgi:hypothetical protein